MFNLPSPIENGWQMENGNLITEYTVLGDVPERIIELVSCRCQKGCKKKFVCVQKVKLVCTDACGCDDNDQCENKDIDFSDDEENDDESDTDD